MNIPVQAQTISHRQIGLPLLGEIGIQLNLRHRLGQHTCKYVPVVKAVEWLHLFPCLFLQF